MGKVRQLLLSWSVVMLAAYVAGPAGRAATPAPAGAHVLMMVEAPGCPHCARFHREIGPAYPNTAEGRFAPLVRRPIDHPEIARFSPPVRYSPTFVLLADGREIGRITGYPGQDFFWPMLAELLGKAGFKQGG